MTMYDMKITKFLGSGSYGCFKLIEFIDAHGDSVYAAMKTSDADDVKYFLHEFEILSKLRGCPRIVMCYGNLLRKVETEKGKQEFRMFMEYAPRGTLRDLMGAHGHRRLLDRLIKEFPRMILEGLVSIHRLGYVHCNLKPAKILVFPRENDMSGSTYEIKLADFGLSREAMKEVGDWWSLDSLFFRTSIYMSPESVCEGKIVAELDLWLLGCIVLEMYTGQLPWPRSEIDCLAHFLSNGDAPTVPETVPCDARKFIETCFARSPEERSSASVLLVHPFLCGEKKPQVDEKTGKIVHYA